ncbi:MAG: heterodisulfide reductase-related iron-sulfur binding cluster [Opitutaceae bacterium]
MQHSIPIEKRGPNGPEMARAIEACVHCGFCLPTCPTYLTMGQEIDSPRGRIFLMKEVLEGRLDPSKAEPHIDNCLGCLACVTACPSGVKYGELVTPYRAWSEPDRRRGVIDRIRRGILLSTLPFPSRFRVSIALGRMARPIRGILPGFLSGMLEMVPADPPPPRDDLLECYPALGARRARVGLLAGCAQQVLSPAINRSAIRVLNRNGIEVVVPRGQACCGALALHTGAGEAARTVARRNLLAFPDDLDAVLTTAAGCGSGIHEYGLLFKGHPEESRARSFAARTRDICVFLEEVGFIPPPDPVGENRIVAYHDACHLAHAQGVRQAPRNLLRSIPGLQVRDIPEADICCGSAGSYNIEHPATAGELGRRKARHLAGTRADVVVTGNIGCLMQLRRHLLESGTDLEVLHTVQLLDART